MIIRQAGEDDHGAVLELYQALSGGTPVAEDAAQWVALLGHPGTSVWGAEMDGGLVAVATLHILPNMTYGGRPYGLIENVVTARPYRGQGFGRQVMERAVAEAWAADAYKIMLLTGQNGRARGFYEKLGFTADEKFGMTMRRVPVRS